MRETYTWNEHGFGFGHKIKTKGLTEHKASRNYRAGQIDTNFFVYTYTVPITKQP